MYDIYMISQNTKTTQNILELKMSRNRLITKEKQRKWTFCSDIILYLMCVLFCDTNLLLQYFKPTHTHTHRNTYIHTYIYMGLPGGSDWNNLPAIQETWVQTLGWEDSVGKGMTTQYSIPLPGKCRGQRSLMGYSPWGSRESDTNSGSFQSKNF